MTAEKTKNQASTAPRMVGMFVGGLILGGIIVGGVMLSRQKQSAVDLSKALGKPLMTVDGKTWSTETLPSNAKMEYYSLESNVYNAELSLASQMALRLALAHDAAKPVTDKYLPTLQDVLPTPAVTDAEAKAYYDRIIGQMGSAVFGGQSFDAIKTQLKAQMTQQKTNEAVASQVQQLQAANRLKILLSPPIAPSVQLDLTGYPTRGNQNSSVVFVEVADYLCPHCREAEPVIEKLAKDYADKIKFVHVSFPLDPNGLSGALARGAFCAQAQGTEQFWSYHAKAFQISYAKMTPAGSPADAPKAFAADTVDVARAAANIDLDKFSKCLDSAEANQYIQRVQGEFNADTGFQGTPAFYLNGKLVQVAPDQLEATFRAALTP